MACLNNEADETTGAGGRTRTGTGLLPTDFKSVAATITPRPLSAGRLVKRAAISKDSNSYLKIKTPWAN